MWSQIKTIALQSFSSVVNNNGRPVRIVLINEKRGKKSKKVIGNKRYLSLGFWNTFCPKLYIFYIGIITLERNKKQTNCIF